MTSPDETRTFEHGKVGVGTLGDFTASCHDPHAGYHVSYRLRVGMDEEEFSPGDDYVIPPGHDAWVVGVEPAVSFGMSRVKADHYAKQ